MGGIFCTEKKEIHETINIDEINGPIQTEEVNEIIHIDEIDETIHIDEINETMHINALNIDCLVEIFLRLPIEKLFEMKEVCVWWQFVSEKTWPEIRRLEFDQQFKLSDGSSLSPNFLRKVLVRCGAHLTYLRLEGIDSSHMLRIISHYCSNLTTIYLQFDFYSDCHVRDARAFSRLRNIKSFTLKDTDQTYSIIFLLCLPRTVESIHLFPSRAAQDSNLPNIFSRFECLNCLEMKSFTLNTDMMESLSYKQTITKLTLSYCNIREGMHYILNLRNLEYLDLSAGDVDGNLLTEFPEHFRKLKYLNLSYVENLSDRDIRKLGYLNNLKELHINFMNKSVTDFSIGLLRGIKKLHCRNCEGVKDDGIMRLIRKCPGLQELNLEGTSITGRTLRFAINETRNRKNSVILKLIADLDRLNFDVENEGHSPFLVIEQS